ncbi:MAG: EamA family transporter, partial [bacterium]|nr:EamA family transporter [bacterium]
THATSSSLLGTSDPIFSVILSAIFLKEAVTNRKVSGLIMAVIGVFVVTTNGIWVLEWGGATGNLLIIGAAMSYSVYTIFSKRILESEPPLLVVTWSTAFGAIFLIATSFILDRNTIWGQLDPHHWGIIAYLSLIPTSVSVVIYFYLLKRIPASQAAISLFLIPVFSILCLFSC